MTDAERVDEAIQHLREVGGLTEEAVRGRLLYVIQQTRARAVASCHDAQRRYRACTRRRNLATNLAAEIEKDERE